MRVLLLSLALILGIGFMASAQTGPTIDFKNTVHDFGNVKQNTDASVEFTFRNTGTEPLIISNVKGVGVTLPNWSRDPVMPGTSSSIVVKYDTKRRGPINKSITVTSNAINSPALVLRIKGNVETSPASQSVPLKEAPASVPIVN